MKSVSCSVFAIAVLMSTSVVALPAAPTAVPGKVQSFAEGEWLEGDWSGPFGNSTYVFRFQHENGAWAGWWVSQRNGQAYPVEDLKVVGQTVSFTYKSDPAIAFSLSLEEDSSLSGTATFESGMVIDYSATRKENG